jgi:tetratricopeptide (TPR) repeat protein
MPPNGEAACLARRTISDLAGVLASSETLLAIESHVFGCEECRQVASPLATVAIRVQAAASRGSQEQHPREALLDTPVSDPEHYPLGKEIARGGMGRIHEAWDRRHARRVAVKLLLRPGAESARRFAREVRITARLQHPSIVPFYEAGTLPTGEPFFAMKLIEGRSLGEVVAQTPSLVARLTLVPQLIAVCEALAYAHGQRVIHRDLKPSNVLIGAFGEAVVIDWGLAKELDAPVDQNAETLDPDVTPGAPSPTLTATGAMLGTPCYMAPEQASGGQVGERTDVYALGAILYHVFAGAPPYLADSPDEVLEHVRHGPPVPLAQVVPELAPDLETIVQKAMARDPGQRYATAAEMAEDLRRLEAGQLVAAHTYSLGALFARWVARHRAALATAAGFAIALAVMGVVSIRRVVRERDRADEAKYLAEHERQTAITQRNAAEGVVEFMIGELKARLQPLGKLELLDGVGGKVADYYRTLAGHAEDPSSLDRHAKALALLSGVEERKQNMPGAIALARDAVAIRERALVLTASSAEAKLALSVDTASLGWSKYRVSDYDGARADEERALALALELVAQDPDDARFQAALGRARRVRGLLAEGVDDAAARTEFEAALAASRRAVALMPDNTEYQFNLTGDHFTLAHVVEDADPDLGEQNWRACLEIVRRLLAKSPDNRLWQRRAAWCQAGIGGTETTRGDWDAALADLSASTAIRDALRKSDQENEEWQREYGSGLTKECYLLSVLGHYGEASRVCSDALSLDEELANKAPDLTSAQEDVANDVQAIAQLELRRGHGARALESISRAISLAEAEAAKIPDDDSVRARLASYHEDAVDAEVMLRDVAAALEHARIALELLTRVSHPSEGLRAAVRLSMGEALEVRGDPSAAEKNYRAALAIDEALDSSSASPSLHAAHARVLGRLGRLLLKDRARRSEARDALEQAVALLASDGEHSRLSPEDQSDWTSMKSLLRTWTY